MMLAIVLSNTIIYSALAFSSVVISFELAGSVRKTEIRQALSVIVCMCGVLSMAYVASNIYCISQSVCSTRMMVFEILDWFSGVAIFMLLGVIRTWVKWHGHNSLGRRRTDP